MQEAKITVDDLRAAGFTDAADEMQRLAEMQRRLAIAYEKYRYIRKKNIDAFNDRLRTDSMVQGHHRITYSQLVFSPIEKYSGIPPADVIASVKEARALKIFDSFEVASIEAVVKVPDPIVFGSIHGCDDRFFIAQWGDDVKISDILGDHDG